MTGGRPSRRDRLRRLRSDLEQDLRPVARPNAIVLLWRWRWELALLVGLPAAIVVVVTRVSWLWVLIAGMVLAAMLSTWPAAQNWVLDHARCVITAHRVRTGCAQAWIHSRYGKLPVILRTCPTPLGERVYLWCRAGICLEDFKTASDVLRSACWASEVYITASPRYSHIVIIDVVRR